MATDKMLKKTAKELNDVMGLNPPIDLKSAPDVLLKRILVAMKFIAKDDVFSADVQEVIDELRTPAKKAAAPAPAKKGKPVPEPEPEEDDEDELVDDDEDEEEEEIPVKAPAKKGKKAPEPEPEDDDEEPEPVKPAKKGKAAPAPVPVTKEKKEKVEKDKTNSPSYVVRYEVCKNPNITDQELANILKKKGMGSLSTTSITIRRKEMLAAIEIFKDLGKL